MIRASISGNLIEKDREKEDSGGTIYGMAKKTTVYMSDKLKKDLEVEARRTGESEAEVIRRAIAAAVERPRPTPGVLSFEPIADRVDELLEGFGGR